MNFVVSFNSCWNDGAMIQFVRSRVDGLYHCDHPMCSFATTITTSVKNHYQGCRYHDSDKTIVLKQELNSSIGKRSTSVASTTTVQPETLRGSPRPPTHVGDTDERKTPVDSQAEPLTLNNTSLVSNQDCRPFSDKLGDVVSASTSGADALTRVEFQNMVDRINKIESSLTRMEEFMLGAKNSMATPMMQRAIRETVVSVLETGPLHSDVGAITSLHEDVLRMRNLFEQHLAANNLRYDSSTPGRSFIISYSLAFHANSTLHVSLTFIFLSSC